MAGFENTIVFSAGEKLSPSSSDDILRMQESATDISKINYTGNPEGNVSANPGSLCHDPVSGIIYYKSTGVGNTGWFTLLPPKNNVVIASPIITGIDFTTTGATLLYTPTSDFIVNSVITIVDSVTGFNNNGNGQVGFNNPDYNNISGDNNVPLGRNDVVVSISTIGDTSSVVTSGSGIYLNVIVGVDALTCVGRAFLTGILI